MDLITPEIEKSFKKSVDQAIDVFACWMQCRGIRYNGLFWVDYSDTVLCKDYTELRSVYEKEEEEMHVMAID